MGSVPGSGRSPGGGNGNLLQYSCLENPMDRGAWQATVHGAAESRTQWRDRAHTHAQTSWGLTTLTHQRNLRPGGYCSAPPPGAPGSAHGPALGREGGHTGPRLGESLGAGVRSCPPLTFTVSLGIFLLAASLRGQSSSVGERRVLPPYFLLSGIPDPPKRHSPPTPWDHPRVHFCTDQGLRIPLSWDLCPGR